MAKKKKKGGLILSLKNLANKAAKNKKNAKKQTQKKTTTNKSTNKNTNKSTNKSFNKSSSTTTKKGGVVISQKTAQKKQAAKKANEKLKKTNTVESAKKAAEKGLKVSGLGTEVKTHTKTHKDKEGSKTRYTYTDLNREEYGKMTTAGMTGQMDNLMKSDKKLAKKVADVNVKDYAESPGVMGAMDQMTQGLSVSENPVFNYSDSQKKIMDSQKQTSKYNVGRAVGAVAEFGLGGTGTVGSSIAKTGGKAVLKEAAEQGGKKLAKQTAKNVAKETAGDVVASAGLNTLDAVKFSYEDGNLNREKFVKELALNVGGDILIGGTVSGLVHGLSARQVSNFNRINKILQKGGKVSDAEMKFYNKHVKELGDKVEQATKQTDTVDKAETQTETQIVRRNSNQEVKTQEPTIAKAATTEKTGDPTPLSNRNIEDVGKRTQKAYMYENPEVKPYFQDEARVLLNDLQNNYVKGEKGFSNTMWDETGNGFFGTTRNIDDDVAELKDKYNWSYEDIEKGLKNIIEDNGKENNAVSKRLEFLIDERLRNGYDDFQYGERISGNDEYMALLRDKEISAYDDEAFNQWVRSLDDGVLAHKLYGEPVSSEYATALNKLESGKPISVEEYRNIPEIADAKGRVATGSSDEIPDSIRGPHRKEVTEKMMSYGSAEVKVIDGKEKVVYTGIVNKNRRADIILGLPASGKSSALVDPISFKYKSKLIDSDEAKKMLDGYDDGWGSGYVHDESSDIIDYVLADAINNGENIVIPKVGGKYKSIDKLRNQLKEEGYSVHIHLVEVNPNKAAGRNLKRFATTGRFVDLEVTSFKYGNKPTEVYEQLVKEGNIDGYTKYSNDVEIGEQPIKLEGTEDISYNWRNDRRSGSNDTGTSKDVLGNDKARGKTELDERLTGAQNASSFNATKQVDVEWEATAKAAAENPGKQFDTAEERIFDENKSPEEWLEKSKRIEDDELPRARQTAKKLVNQAEDDVADIIEPWVRDGYYNKKVLQSQEEARTQALAELNDGTLYRKFMDSDVTTNEHLFMARAEALLNDLMKKAPESDDAAMQLLEVMDKATDASSHGGRLLNATKMLLRNTSEGRIRMFSKEIDRLNDRFKDVLKGKELKLTPEQIKSIANATEENIEEVAEQINKEIWEDIPATWFEKFNEMRHASMLFNLKTHGRNVLGNSVFWGGRLISDGIEIAAYKVPAVKRRLEKLGGNVQMVHVTRKELADNKETINEIFDSFYKKSDSKNKFVESTRPDGMTAVKNKPMSKFIQTNYKFLEAEDMIAFKPEYRKNFIRWCKTHKVDDISKMSQKQMREANMYAMSRAERATFRDDSAFAKKIVGLKNTTATKTGKTPMGTAMYRAGNVALESSLPFVKTPVNILRRSVDYSPIGLARGAAELMNAKSADMFMEGVTHMASGLTGTGVFALGIWLANKDLITVKAGEESGDAYYDRDMGYQDYSLVLGFGDKEYSLTIDWLSPMQVSLFMGANAFNNLSDGKLTFEDMLDGVLAISGPMLDMSFMSSAKDTLQTFMEKVYRNGTGEDADWSGAIMKTLFGSVPQGYLSGFVPQLMSQTATALDSKQRDTRSTKEDPIAASWDSFAKKLANKIPVLRNKVLNPKIDRFGEDVTTGNNIVTRLLNAYANPSTVKEIKRTDLDNEIIDIYNHMEDGDEKKYFYYNFTGNPSYDLGDGKRMSYDELYKYGKSKRIDQTKSIQSMVDSKSYKNMTYDMKATEIGKAHWTSQTHADQKTYGSDFALGKIIDGNFETDSRAAKLSQQMGVSSKEFVDFYLTKEKLIARSHDSDWNTKALAVALSGNDRMAALYSVNVDKVDIAKKYLKNGGSAEEYSTASCNIVSEIKKADATISNKNKALAAAYHTINERTYTALGLSTECANMGVGLKKYGYDFDKLAAMQVEMKYGGFDADKNGYINKSEVVDYIESLGITDTTKKACLFEYLCTSSAKNPYGSIPNYLGFGSSDSTGSGGGKGGGKKSSGKKSSNLPSWEEWVKDYLEKDTTEYKSVEFDRWDSPLDSAYRKRISELHKKM